MNLPTFHLHQQLKIYLRLSLYFEKYFQIWLEWERKNKTKTRTRNRICSKGYTLYISTFNGQWSLTYICNDISNACFFLLFVSERTFSFTQGIWQTENANRSLIAEHNQRRSNVSSSRNKTEKPGGGGSTAKQIWYSQTDIWVWAYFVHTHFHTHLSNVKLEAKLLHSAWQRAEYVWSTCPKRTLYSLQVHWNFLNIYQLE